MSELQRCNICKQIKPINLYILGNYICSDCEQTIIKAKVGNKRYNMIMSSLKRITDEAISRSS